MEANELMIGDWVFRLSRKSPDCAQIRTDGFITRITEQGAELCYLDRWQNRCYMNAGFGELHPRPITAEILEKNGFTKTAVSPLVSSRANYVYETSEETVYMSENGIMWWIEMELADYAGKIEMPIEYVHVLQHALRLFGIKKQIEL